MPGGVAGARSNTIAPYADLNSGRDTNVSPTRKGRVVSEAAIVLSAEADDQSFARST
ncbi:hypothetical protein EV291_103180 [Rhizobium sp. BK068]|nr:hypothetical protein [Rhizobium sp. BK060]TCM79860.1 hypothetical protein EV291_103180 [Rhizobium sp. BK068]